MRVFVSTRRESRCTLRSICCRNREVSSICLLVMMICMFCLLFPVQQHVITNKTGDVSVGLDVYKHIISFYARRSSDIKITVMSLLTFAGGAVPIVVCQCSFDGWEPGSRKGRYYIAVRQLKLDRAIGVKIRTSECATCPFQGDRKGRLHRR